MAEEPINPDAIPYLNELKNTPRLEIVRGWTYIIDGDYSYIEGSVENIGEIDVGYFEVTAEYMDSNGNILDTDYTNSGQVVKPGSQKVFKIMHEHKSELTKVSVSVTKTTK